MKALILLFFFVGSFEVLQSQELIVLKKKGKINTITKTLTYKRMMLSLNGNIVKMIYSGKGNEECYDLKNYSTEMDSLYHFSEVLILNSLLQGKRANDTIVNGLHFVWKNAILRQKNNIKGLEYKLKVTKVD